MEKVLEPKLVGRYLDPTNDLAFKKVFGTEEHKPSLISFLNAILSLENEKRIVTVDFLPKEQIPIVGEGKFSVLDVKCTDERGHQYIIEMQSRAVKDFTKRSQYYASHSYVSQGFSGKKFGELKPVVFLAILDHILFPEDEHVISCHHTLDIKTNKHKLKNLRYFFIELPKFKKNVEDLKTIQDQWIYYFKNWNRTTDIPAGIRDEGLIEAYHTIEKFNWTVGEMDEYVKSNLARTSYEYELEDKWNKGMKAGVEKGKKEGIREGIKEGKLAVASKLLKLGTSIEDVVAATGLSKDELS